MAKTSAYMRKEMREHQIEVALINAFAADPTLKYWVAVGGGMLITAILAALKTPSNDTTASLDEQMKRGLMDYVALVGGGASGLVVNELVGAFQTKAKESPFGTLIGMSATFTGVNVVCLILSSMSGGKDSGGLVSKITMGVI